jgi:hypothetical protein
MDRAISDFCREGAEVRFRAEVRPKIYSLTAPRDLSIEHWLNFMRQASHLVQTQMVGFRQPQCQVVDKEDQTASVSAM